MFLVLTAPSFFFFWQPPVCFVGCRFLFSPHECLGSSDDVNYQREATCSGFLHAAALAACGEVFPPKGVGYTDIIANERATWEVTEKKKTKSRDSYPSFSLGGGSGLWTGFSSVMLCLCVFLAWMGQRDDSETQSLAEARVLNGLCLQPQGICLTSQRCGQSGGNLICGCH